jgi:broad specificity phosphatase PhoE
MSGVRPLAPVRTCSFGGVRLLVLARHGQSLLNVDGVVNGDPALDRGLAPLGIEQAHGLAAQIAAVAIDACVVSTFPRAQETARLALSGRAKSVPITVDPDLDDVRVGELEGCTLEDYRVWKRGRSRGEPFPGGESLHDTTRRCADAYERVLARPEDTILCICHEVPVRYAVNAAAGSPELDGPLHNVANATPYLFDTDGLSRAIERMRALTGAGEADR